MAYPEKLEIVQLRKPPDAAVSVPGSKSITNRALVLAALSSGGNCVLEGCLRSDDTEVMVQALRDLGITVETSWNAGQVRLPQRDSERIIPACEADLFVANSGTTMRFLTALVALGHGRYRLDGTPRMRERPIEDLLAALRQLGVQARSEKENACPPVIIESTGMQGGEVAIRADLSSQFLSGLLMAAPLSKAGLLVEVRGECVSEPYVEMTLEVMRRFGISVHRDHFNRIIVPGGQRFGLRTFPIEPDASAASYFFAAAALTGGRVTVLDLPENSIQGDVHFVDLLADMGCRVEKCSSGITVHGRPLHGIDVDMNAISDTVMTLAAVACFAEGPTSMRNVAHIRHKETDRLAALSAELRMVGAEVEEFADGLRITPRPLHGAEIETYNDHRMAMSMALIGLKVPGIVIQNPGCVAKTYPDFFRDLEKLR